MAVLPFTLPFAAGWPKIWVPQGERCLISMINLFLPFGTETPGQRCQKEGSLNLYSIKSVDNDADELKITFLAHWNNNFNWTAQEDFIQTCWLPVVQGDIDGSFFPLHEHFHLCCELFCQNTRKCPNLAGRGGRRPCGVGTSSLVALAGGWVNKTSLSKHKKGALYHQYDCNFHNMIGSMLCLDSSVMYNYG